MVLVQIWSPFTKYGPGMNYLSSTVKWVQYFGSRYLKRTFEKNSYEIGTIKYGPAMKYF